MSNLTPVKNGHGWGQKTGGQKTPLIGGFFDRIPGFDPPPSDARGKERTENGTSVFSADDTADLHASGEAGGGGKR